MSSGKLTDVIKQQCCNNFFFKRGISTLSY
jgi:hypothetical protein